MQILFYGLRIYASPQWIIRVDDLVAKVEMETTFAEIETLSQQVLPKVNQVVSYQSKLMV